MENKTPACVNVVPLYGQIIVHAKWRGSVLVLGFKGSVTPIFEDELGVVDFHLSDKSCVLYVSESDLVAGPGYKRKLVKFRNAKCSLHGIVVVEKTRLTEQYFPAVQKFVVFELGLTLLPVTSQIEASQLITLLVQGESKEGERNPFLRRSSSWLSDPLVLALVQQIPGVGKVRAGALLQHFPSIYQLSNASTQDLEHVVGLTTAQHVRAFFTQS